MTLASVTTERAAAHSAAARLLAHWWSRPTQDEAESWAECWPGACEVAELLGLACSGVEALRAAFVGSPVDALLDEYERLLIGPGRAPCPPYESLWRGDGPRREQGRLMGAAAAEVVQLYREIGLQVRVDAHELPDHLTIEWEALAYAFEHDAGEAATSLVEEHLAVWIPPFCSAVEAEAEHPFYAALARLTGAWTDALAG